MICVRQLPVVEKLAREFSGNVRFVKVQTTEDDGTFEAFGVSSYPAYIVFRDGREVDRLTLNFAPWLIEERLRRIIEGSLHD
jgi:thioredoxin-like negative regulator of GroEL